MRCWPKSLPIGAVQMSRVYDIVCPGLRSHQPSSAPRSSSSQHLLAIPPDQVFVSIVTVEEQLRGWLALIRRAQVPEGLISAYASLHRAVVYFATVNILDYGEVAARHVSALRAQRIRIGTQDLRIAAVSLAANAILVTRNQNDFRQVPNLIVEDWSRPIL
jgi:tRNA(fMet)-specific endonuclease VapC